MLANNFMKRSPFWLVAILLISACHDKQNVLTVSEPTAVVDFCVLDSSGSTLWQVAPEGAPVAMERIDYGVVPAGYTQKVPSEGLPPRQFVKGEKLSMELETPAYFLTHEGYAEGPKSFLGGDYHYRPKGPPKPVSANRETRNWGRLTMALQPIPARATVSVGCIISEARRAGWAPGVRSP
ncbi:MAG: hypothetical protein NDJ92_00245 [Thermoanaerobaculia bacterium]|nr:hypothetical protein [Thermoanaerobaculia bacterium]